GFGRRRFAAARRDLAQSGLKSLVVWALSDNEPAVEFYRALGGRAVARSSEKFGAKTLDKVAFAWRAETGDARLTAAAGWGTAAVVFLFHGPASSASQFRRRQSGDRAGCPHRIEHQAGDRRRADAARHRR